MKSELPDHVLSHYSSLSGPHQTTLQNNIKNIQLFFISQQIFAKQICHKITMCKNQVRIFSKFMRTIKRNQNDYYC